MVCLTTLLLLAPGVYAGAVFGRQEQAANSSCKAIPGDNTWPSQQAWGQLNQTIGGRLIETVPQAAICHPGGYAGLSQNQTACDSLKKEWDYPKAFLSKASEIMNPFFQNTSCSPYYRTDQPCTLGKLVSYAVPVESPADVVAAINFTQTHNVRLVIKNTGHDWLGKSTGTGGLSLWTHNLKAKQVLNYTSTHYAGPAIKVGAGVTGGEALTHASKSGYRLVSGDCPTVGYAGGYSSGGGHGLLNSVHGLAADNVLEWEVVTADGRHLIASPEQNSDLYWAMSGGGGGTFAVALSMTARLHPDGIVGAASLSFNATSAPSNTSFVSALNAWWKFLPSLVDAGATPSWNVYTGHFLVPNTTAPGRTAADMDTLYLPYLSELKRLNIPYTYTSYSAPNYFQHYNDTDGPLPYGPYQASQLFNSRLIPRNISDDPSELIATMLSMSAFDPAANWQFGCLGININSSSISNAVTPHWRSAIAICLEFSLYNWTVPEDVMVKRRVDLAAVIHPAVEKVTVGGGAYLNEADPLVYPEGDSAKWQEAFYGSTYERLREVKRTWDPRGVFYSYSAVGSEDWVQDGEGRLCRV
ncbi:BBE multi-domain protein [Pyrenophora tritici-repentis]|uniref:FAD binding domain containing protein n=1 Tax=Pyrenophora tritici-repentis TaxID=45151 RepID=A0A317AY56_9PLEO|nr:GlcD FAD/FMN-containing dehydrogenase [Pyrenophora tritici-repentis]KAF7448135.1 GlcD FAD/FMN-containing dehydrogenase [Pyrenophora tritici-repentis]KAF7571846.1 GlcD, FAD/FMN-containing dehydrogenase [Pyrenophora tritici-repentis]KAI0571877.1 GlcD FAD/FMN-containing dehydrogenase [Pyrenophora tritici-repentis]KAI0573310.1 GlcD FAD/FMN-containing dehydrogenase [Pyrenophora tritici-repentis]